MKAVVAHGAGKPVELDWAKQYAGLDTAVKNQFTPGADWPVRVPRVFTITGFTWSGIVSTVSAAAVAAGTGGVVIIATGHGGAVFQNDPNGDGGMVSWDPTDGNVDLDWTPTKIHKGLFWDDMVARYLDPIPMGNPPNQKGIDEQNINNKVQGWELIKKRHDAFDALQSIGQALKSNGVARLAFTVCTAGRATAFMNRLAKICGVEVACFKETTMVLDDATFGQKPGKSRLIMEKDKARDGVGSNVPSARVRTPSLDDSNIAFVAQP